ASARPVGKAGAESRRNMDLTASCAALAVAAFGFQVAYAGTAVGPLQVSNGNARYFSDPTDRPIYLTGSHTWTNLQDDLPSAPFDFDEYLAFLGRHGHNFIRLWMLETAAWEGAGGQLHRRDPLPYDRPGPGIARDGKPKFDLMTLNVKYFDRLRARVAAAQDRGIYVSVMLFNGWSLERKGIDRRSWLQRGIA